MAVDRSKLAQRFWAKVDRSSSDGCWPWLGSRVGGRYGRTSVDGVLFLTHRVAWMLSDRTLTDKYILHHCDNPSCCRPDHLFEGTQADNMEDMKRKGRHRNGNVEKTHCLNGHELNTKNCLVLRNGDRRCRVCHSRRVIESVRRVKQANRGCR